MKWNKDYTGIKLEWTDISIGIIFLITFFILLIL
jgi:hypothetical protein